MIRTFFLQYNNGEIWKDRSSKRKVFRKKSTKIWDVDVDNIVISRLVYRTTNSNYWIEYLDKYMRPLGLIMPKKE